MDKPSPRRDPEKTELPKPQAPARPTMLDALAEVFAFQRSEHFAQKIAELAQALTNARWVAVYVLAEDGVVIPLAGGAADVPDEALEQARTLLTEDGKSAEVRAIPAHVIARIALPDQRRAALAIGLAQAGGMQNALAYERLAFLASLSFARFLPEDRMRQDDLVTRMQHFARDGSGDLNAIVDLLALHTGAGFAAAAVVRDSALSDMVISGQDGRSKRASLPESLRADMKTTVSGRQLTGSRAFAARANATDGLVLHLEKPVRNHAVLPMLASLFALEQNPPRRRWPTPARLVKLGAVALVLVGIALIPLPDGVELSAVVEAETQRVVTAPLTATLVAVDVADGAHVTAGETPLLRFETNDTDLELIGVRAEQAKALLERETARAARNAGALRNAELEVERLTARIALLQSRQAQALVLAPISGVIVAPGLAEREGTLIRQGEDLLVVSDPEALRLQLSVPQSQIGRLKTEATGIFRPDFDPTIRIDSQVSLISSAELGEGPEKFFLGRATFDGPVDRLRPGLNGVLSVQRDFRPLGLIVYRALRDYVLLKIWL